MSPDRIGYQNIVDSFRRCRGWQQAQIKDWEESFNYREGKGEFLVLISKHDEEGKFEFDMFGILIPNKNKFNSGKIILPMLPGASIFAVASNQDMKTLIKTDKYAYCLDHMAKSNNNNRSKLNLIENALTGQFEVLIKDEFPGKLKISCLELVLNGDSELFKNQPIYGWQVVDNINDIPPLESLAEGVAQEFESTFPEFKIKPYYVPNYMEMEWNNMKKS